MKRPVLRIGIDLGGTAIKLAALLNSQPPVCLRSPAYARPTRRKLEQTLRTAWRQFQEQLDTHAPLTAGICVPGPLSPNGILEAAANLPALVGTPIGPWVQQVLSLDRPPRVLTDALAAALGECRAHPRPGRVLYLSLGGGVGGILLDDGHPLLFTRGTSGHIGHIDVSGGQPHAPATPAAGRGALEAYIGAPALQRAGLDLRHIPPTSRHPALTKALAALARALRILLALYRPDHIVLLGGVGLALEPFLPRLNALTRDALTTAAPAHFTLSCARTGYFAAALGAATSQGPAQKLHDRL